MHRWTVGIAAILLLAACATSTHDTVSSVSTAAYAPSALSTHPTPSMAPNDAALYRSILSGAGQAQGLELFVNRVIGGQVATVDAMTFAQQEQVVAARWLSSVASAMAFAGPTLQCVAGLAMDEATNNTIVATEAANLTINNDLGINNPRMLKVVDEATASGAIDLAILSGMGRLTNGSALPQFDVVGLIAKTALTPERSQSYFKCGTTVPPTATVPPVATCPGGGGPTGIEGCIAPPPGGAP